MLQICEEYVFNYKITFNATKSQLLYFGYLGKDHSDLLSLIMKNGNVIPYVSKCLHLGTTIYTTLYRDNVIDVVNELYKRTNYLLSDFSFALYPIYLRWSTTSIIQKSEKNLIFLFSRNINIYTFKNHCTQFLFFKQLECVLILNIYMLPSPSFTLNNEK